MGKLGAINGTVGKATRGIYKMQAAPSSAYRLALKVLAFLMFTMLVLEGSPGCAEPTAKLTGTITDMLDGRVQNVMIELISIDAVLQTNSNAMGQFEFSGLPHGTYALRATIRGFKTKTIEGIDIGDKDLDLSFIRLEVASPGCGATSWLSYEASNTDRRSIEGSISLITNALDATVSSKSGEEAKIELFSIDADRPTRSEHPDKNGKFQFRNLEPGIYFIRASRAGFDDAQSANFYVTRKDQTKVILSLLKTGQIFVCM